MGTKLFSDLITFTRASSATRVNSSGLVEAVASDQPRFDYNPVTLQSKGLLIEEQRTNLLTYSEQFDNAAWGATGGTVTANTVTSPNGTVDADSFIESANSTDPRFPVGYSFTSGVKYTLSVYAKAIPGSAQRYLMLVFNSGYATPSGCNFDLVAGTVGASSSAAGTIQSVGNGWYRCTMTPSANATGIGALRIRVAAVNTSGNIAAPAAYTGDGTSGIYIWGAQLEAGDFPTSYIPTTTAAATRAADVATITGSNFSSWYRQDEGTLFAEFGPFGDGGPSRNPGIISIDDGTNNNLVRLFAGSTISPVFGVNVGGVSQAYISNGTLTPSQVSKIAGAYKTNDFARSLNGAGADTDLAGTVPSVSLMRIGTGIGGVFDLNGHIRRITYYPRRLTDAELQALTA